MAKANIITKNGTTIAIEGTAEEVSLLIERFNGGDGSFEKHGKKESKSPAAKSAAVKSRSKAGPKSRIVELIEEGFFKKPKSLGDIKTELEVRAHFYAMNELSTPILRAVKARELRRIKDAGAWKYAEA